MKVIALATCAVSLLLAVGAVRAQGSGEPGRVPFDPELARSVGADENGMRRYVLVVLKTGPTRVPDGPERDDMFKGHFAT